MKLYHLSLLYGEYSDAGEYFVGTFSSPEIRESCRQQLIESCEKLNADDWNSYNEMGYFKNCLEERDSRWSMWETNLDESVFVNPS